MHSRSCNSCGAAGPLRISALAAAIALAVIALPGRVEAQDAPAQPQPRPGAPTPGTDAPPGEAPDSVVVRGFRLTGNESVPTAELEALLAPYVGERCDIRKLREAADRVTEEYRRRGLSLARAYVPVQQIREGVVEIAVLEGRIGDVKVEGNRNYSEEFVRSHIVVAVTGTAATAEGLERALLILGDYRDLAVTATLERGREPGTVDVRAAVKDHFPIRPRLYFNNFGSDFVSRHRFGAEIDWVDCFPEGALLSAGGLVGEKPDDLAYGYGTYTTPLNAHGTKLGVTGSYGDFQVSEEFADLGVHGKQASLGAFVAHPFVKSRTLDLSAELGIQGKDAKFYFLDELASRDKVRTVYAAARLGLVHWGGKTLASLNVTQGLGENFGGMDRRDPKSSRLRADDEFTRLTGLAARLQPLGDIFSVFLRLSGQWSSDELVASEEWQVGGADTVRGYGPGEATGDHGYLASLEVRAAPLEDRDVLQLAAFADHGGAFRKTPLAGQRSESYLTGAGIGVRSRFDLYVEADLRFDLGFPLDPSKNTLNEDPTYYVSASIRF